MKKTIQNIIFDVGNVLFNYDPNYITSKLLPKKANQAFYIDHLFNAPIWQQLDRGDTTTNEAIQTIKKNHPEADAAHLKTLITKFPDHLTLNTPIKTIFTTFTKQYNVYILSNFQAPQYERLKKNHAFLSTAKGTAISSSLYMKKPEIGIYHYLLTKYGLNPNRSIFIDDLEENIATAKKLCINSITFKSEPQLKQDLKKYEVHV